MKKITVKNITFSNNLPIKVIAGPCQIESKEHAYQIAAELLLICRNLGMDLVFKSSFDKANRSSINGQRGVGPNMGLDILSYIKSKLGIPVLTDIHEKEQAKLALANDIDIIQIPAFLCRQTDLLLAAGETGLAINVKKGQFLAPHDMKNVAEKIASTGNERIMLCERGYTHGYNNLVVDMRSLPIMAGTEYPVIFDCTHSVQQPGGLGASTGGDRRMVPYLARAAVATGCLSAVFIECHDDPDHAPSDGPNMIKMEDMPYLLKSLKEIDYLVKNK
ncbi:MAG: 3-deoxy-8-phosphooctulonate synthase [Actinobacteria bacterium]|nr:3-deoxy-8-phosphooctulonate synthase [Actinomycetota bacterium]